MELKSIFVTYDPADVEFAKKLMIDLRDSGADVIMDHVGPHDAASEQFLVQELPQYQQLIVVQTPRALQSLHVRTIVDTAVEYMQQGKMAGVLCVIAPTLDTVEVQEVPATWTTTSEIDASQDYPKALVRLRSKLHLPNSYDSSTVSLPFSYIPPVGPHDPKEIGNQLPASDSFSSQHPGPLGRLPRPHNYLHIPFRPLLIFCLLGIALTLVVAGTTIFIYQRSTAVMPNPAIKLASAHNPTSVLTPTQSLQLTQQPQPTPQQSQLMPTSQSQPASTQYPQLVPTPTPTHNQWTYEAEASQNTLGGHAYVDWGICPKCSGGALVFNIGTAPGPSDGTYYYDGTLQFNNIFAPTSGTYYMTVFYCDYYRHGTDVYINVNGGGAFQIQYPSVGICSDSTMPLGQVTSQISLSQGSSNTILFSNPHDYSSSDVTNGFSSYIDRIVIRS